MSDYIIKVENLGKKYRIQHQGERERYVALRDVIASKAAAPLRWLRNQTSAFRSQKSASNNGNGTNPMLTDAMMEDINSHISHAAMQLMFIRDLMADNQVRSLIALFP